MLINFLVCTAVGVEAVVNCLQVMHGLAASAEMPRKARSAVTLVLLWLILLVAAVYLLHTRRQ